MSHVNLGKTNPESYNALLALNTQIERVARVAGLDPLLVELVKIRASQLNGCAFCLRRHTVEAIKAGETPERLAVLPAWWESQCFTAKEQASLHLAESVTLISDHGRLPDRGIDASAVLEDEEIAAITWLAIVINAWNRVAISSHYPVGA